MPKVSEQYLADRRQQILEAAIACFARNGFHQTTMQDVYTECGLSPGAVYNYFKSKDDMVVAACFDSQEQNIALLEDLKAEQDTRTALQRLIATILSQVDIPGAREGIGMNLELWAEALHNPRVRALMAPERVLKPLIEIIARSQQLGEINPELDPEAVARVIVATINGLIPQLAFDDLTDVGKYGTAVIAILTGRYWTGTEAQAH